LFFDGGQNAQDVDSGVIAAMALGGFSGPDCVGVTL
jgi:hypothetical protein